MEGGVCEVGEVGEVEGGVCEVGEVERTKRTREEG